MKRKSYIRHDRITGRKAGVRRLVFIICAAVLPAFAGSLFAAGAGGVDQVSGWYPVGTNLTVTATSQEYSVFDRWDGNTNGVPVSSTNSVFAFTVTAPSDLTAVFKERLTASNSVPYSWLASVGITNDFENAVTNDPDGDSFTTAQEYWAGTDPTTNASYLNISHVEMTTTNFRLIWAHSNIGAYQPEIVIQSRASLSAGDWTNAVVRTATNGPNSWVAPPGQQAAFYRLVVTNMP